jgi:hypothetical protein
MLVVAYLPKFGNQGKPSAQRKALSRFLETTRSEVAAEFVQVDPGIGTLKSAIDTAQEIGASLVIARLGSRSKSLPALRLLRDARIPFLALDDQRFDPRTIDEYLRQAEEAWHQRSQRIRKGLATAVRRGAKLGSARPGHWNKKNEHKRGWKKASAASAARRAARVADAYMPLVPRMESMRADGATFEQIALALNQEGHVTTRGVPFTASTVFKILGRQERQHDRA